MLEVSSRVAAAFQPFICAPLSLVWLDSFQLHSMDSAGLGSPPTSPFSPSAFMLALSVQRYCGFTFLPLLFILMSHNCFSKNRRETSGCGRDRVLRLIPTHSHCGGKMVHFQWGTWLFLPDHALSGHAGGVE